MEKARKWLQELFAFSFMVPSFQSHLILSHLKSSNSLIEKNFKLGLLF